MDADRVFKWLTTTDEGADVVAQVTRHRLQELLHENSQPVGVLAVLYACGWLEVYARKWVQIRFEDVPWTINQMNEEREKDLEAKMPLKWRRLLAPNATDAGPGKIASRQIASARYWS